MGSQRSSRGRDGGGPTTGSQLPHVRTALPDTQTPTLANTAAVVTEEGALHAQSQAAAREQGRERCKAACRWHSDLHLSQVSTLCLGSLVTGHHLPDHGPSQAGAAPKGGQAPAGKEGAGAGKEGGTVAQHLQTCLAPCCPLRGPISWGTG